MEEIVTEQQRLYGAFRTSVGLTPGFPVNDLQYQDNARWTVEDEFDDINMSSFGEAVRILVQVRGERQ
jgi:hypothetical protein